jgi:nucleoside-diphosphate-sugar epimerase
LCVVTGATGLLGSHVAEQLVARGDRVRALVRPGGDTSFLRPLGAELAVGDLADPASLAGVVSGADVVYHCAAQVGDWGPWERYRQGVVEATANLLGACRAAGVGRFLHVSSINVYGHPNLRGGRLLGEDEPLGQRLWWWDHYCRAKILAEEAVRAYPGPWTVVRPTWIYGPRDRNSMPRVIRALRNGQASIVGRGDNRLNLIHAADAADGVIRAANHPGAVGQAYNLASEGALSQREYIDLLTQALGLPSVRLHVPFFVAFAGGFLCELIGRAIRLPRPPRITRYAVALIGRSTLFRSDKARDQLGWRPAVDPLDGLRQTLAWHLGREQNA